MSFPGDYGFTRTRPGTATYYAPMGALDGTGHSV